MKLRGEIVTGNVFNGATNGDDIVTRKLDLTSGSLALPDGPGLGVTLDEARLAKYRFGHKAAA